MPIALAIVAVAGLATSVAGAVVKANAGAKGADAAQGIADAQKQAAMSERQQAMQAAMPSASEIQQISDRLQTQSRYQALQEASIQRDTKIMNSLDPALVTAGQEANDLMKGKEAAILAPMKQNQEFQKRQMEQQLAAQLGPGYKTSTVGQQAMQTFAMQSNMQLQQAQMQSFQQVSQFLGYGISARSQIQNEERQGFMTGNQMSNETLNATSNIQSRQMQAVLGTSKGIIDTAGAEYAGAAGQARAQAGIGESLGTIGGAIAGAGSGLIGKGGGGSPVGDTSSANTLGGSAGSSFTMPKFGSSLGRTS